ncbi:TIGR04086 family membrane protein [Haloimpatiens sp. FM7330]|uniref:TIGR04086 family membrane protein n=1 Tax=Haloimpatiens sp. FM7330 TaxID=3298610 RepID=UPI003633A300
MNNKKMNYVINGLIRAFMMTVGFTIVFSVINYFIPSIESVKHIFILILSLVSIMYGAFYASKKSQQKGWLLGLIIALMYMVIIYLVSVIAGRTNAFGLRDLLRIMLALLVGMLSGMLGINI